MEQRAQSTAEVQRREFRNLSLVRLSRSRCSCGRPSCCGAGEDSDCRTWKLDWSHEIHGRERYPPAGRVISAALKVL
jgi:hypothetical protein